MTSACGISGLRSQGTACGFARVCAILAGAILALSWVAGMANAAGPATPLVGTRQVMPSLDLGTSDSDVSIASNGFGTMLAVWSSNDSLDGTIGYDFDILFSLSYDFGNTWDFPKQLNTNAATDTGNDLTPSVATDRKGRWVVVWSSTEPLTNLETDKDILFSTMTVIDHFWSAPEAVNIFASVDTFDNVNPVIDVDNFGNWVLLFETLPAGILTAETLDPTTSPVGIPGAVVITNAGAARPHLTSDGRGRWVAVYETVTGAGSADGDLKVVTSTDPGVEWTAGPLLNSNAATDVNADRWPRIETDRRGTWITVWESVPADPGAATGNRDAWLSRSVDNGVTWSAMQQLDSDFVGPHRDETRPAIDSDRNGNWFASWTIRDTTGPPHDSDIFFQRSIDGGVTWGLPSILNFVSPDDGTTLDDVPQLANNGKGNWIGFWQDTQYVGLDLNDRRILRNRFFQAPFDLSPLPTPVSDDVQTPNNDSAFDSVPQLASDGQGMWIGVWERADSESSTDIIGADIAFSRSGNNGATWAIPTILNSTGTGPSVTNRFPHIATDGDGRWIAVWQSTQIIGSAGVGDFDILYSVSNNQGVNWSAPAVLNTNAASDSYDDIRPRIASDGQGRWICAWSSQQDETLVNYDIHYSIAGVTGTNWSAPASLIPGGTGSAADDYCDLATDNAGAWIVVWESTNDIHEIIAVDHDIHFSRSTNNGASWSPPANLNTSGGLDSLIEHAPRIATQGGGVWGVVWQTDIGLRFARSTNSGATWSPSVLVGLDFIEPARIRVAPAIAADRLGNWFLAWEEVGVLDNGVTDPYETARNIFITYSPDAGLTWFDPISFEDTDPETFRRQYFDRTPALANDGKGNWVGLWYGFDEGESESDILFGRFSYNNTAAGPAWMRFR